MSTRYVWEKCEIGREETTEFDQMYCTEGYGGELTSGTIAGYAAAEYTVKDGLTYELVPPVQSVYYTGTNRQIPTAPNKYFVPKKTGSRQLAYDPYPSASRLWTGTYRSAARELGTQLVQKTGGNLTFPIKKLVDAKGEVIGYVSSSNSSAHPDDKWDGYGYWYKKLGSDTIDPVSVTYSASELKPGDQVTITITPTVPQLGGTIYYQYSVRTTTSLVWNAWGGKTTETSKTYTIPSTAKYFSVRVVAGDDWGFTSTTIVAGPTIAIPQPEKPEPAAGGKLYVGIDGKARQILKMYVGVNNVAREVKAGYIGVSGTARKFL